MNFPLLLCTLCVLSMQMHKFPWLFYWPYKKGTHLVTLAVWLLFKCRKCWATNDIKRISKTLVESEKMYQLSFTFKGKSYWIIFLDWSNDKHSPHIKNKIFDLVFICSTFSDNTVDAPLLDHFFDCSTVNPSIIHLSRRILFSRYLFFFREIFTQQHSRLLYRSQLWSY